MPAPLRTRCGPIVSSRSTISIPATVYEKGAEVDRHAAHAARAGAFPPRHGPLFRPPRRRGGHLRRFRRRRCRTPRASTSRSSGAGTARQGRRASRAAARTTRPRSVHARGRASHARHARPARQAALPHPARRRSARRRMAATFRCASTARRRRLGLTRVLDVREPAQTFGFDGVTAKPVPSLLRGFSAPVDGRVRLRARGTRVPRRARQRPRQPLGRRAAQLRRTRSSRSRATTARAGPSRCRPRSRGSCGGCSPIA